MRKIYLSLMLLFVASFSFASSGDLFDLNYEQVKQEFVQLDQLAVKVKAENLTYNDLLTTDASLINNMALSNAAMVPLPEGPLGIPSFLWGCVLGPIGIVIAYVMTDNDKDEAKKALWGCLAGYGAGLIIYIIVAGATLSAAASTGY